MKPDPIAVQTLHDAGFAIVPRFSDRTRYNQEAMNNLLADYKKLGVTRILFEGDAVKGYADNARNEEY